MSAKYNLRSRNVGDTKKVLFPASTTTHPDSDSERRRAVLVSTSLSSPTHAMADVSSKITDDPRLPLLPAHSPAALSQRHPSSSTTQEREDTVVSDREEEMENLSKKSQWIVLALASGACAAFNGVFAKLTTTELTTNFATGIANFVGLSNVEGGVEVVVRALFFILNLVFNGIMWTLFTKALARGTSTTQVSILNTSSNFMITAVLGALIFSEKLPGMWFVGAALLVAGNVIIGRRDEGEEKGSERAENGEEEGEGLLGEVVELEGQVEVEGRKGKEDEEDILDFRSESDDDASKRIGPEALRRDW